MLYNIHVGVAQIDELFLLVTCDVANILNNK